MKRSFLGCLLCMATLCMTIGAHASTPLWSYTPLTATTIAVPVNGSATVQYQITNQSAKTHTLSMKSIPGITQDTSGGLCASPFTLAYQQSCTLSLNISGAALSGPVQEGPVVCEQGSALQCYQPDAANSLNISVTSATTTLAVSLSTLALQTSGNTRTITLTNTGSFAAENVSITPAGLPTGTFINSNCGSILNPSDSCTIDIVPGASASSDCNAGQGSEPTPGTITANADNANSVTSSVFILAYGCIYQEGYVFAIDDTTPTSTSIGGSTAALIDNSLSTSWSPIFQTTGAQSLTDGPSNTVDIVTTFGAGTYAASVCTNYSIDSSGNSPCATGTCYSNWYLPAVCQMGGVGEGASCSGGTQNMVDNLPGLIDSGCSGSTCLTGTYWSSTEIAASPLIHAWAQIISSGTNLQIVLSKVINNDARCARDF